MKLAFSQRCIGWLALLLATTSATYAAPVFTVSPAGNAGFDVYADGVLAAPIRLAANGAIVADTIESSANGVRLSGLRASDSQAVTFEADDFVSITLSTNPAV